MSGTAVRGREESCDSYILVSQINGDRQPICKGGERTTGESGYQPKSNIMPWSVGANSPVVGLEGLGLLHSKVSASIY